MSKHKPRPPYDPSLIGILQSRANMLTFDRGHLLGVWQPAKKKHGKGSMRAWCSICGAGVIVTPRQDWWQGDHLRIVPIIKGEALFDKCEPAGAEHVH